MVLKKRKEVSDPVYLLPKKKQINKSKTKIFICDIKNTQNNAS